MRHFDAYSSLENAVINDLAYEMQVPKGGNTLFFIVSVQVGITFHICTEKPNTSTFRNLSVSEAAVRSVIFDVEVIQSFAVEHQVS